MLIFATINKPTPYRPGTHGLKHRIVAFIFLLITALPVFLSIEFIVKENLIQQEAEEKMESVALQSVTVSASDLIWIRKGKEAMIEGKLFDIKSFSSENKRVILLGYFDEEEDRFLQDNKAVNEHEDGNSPMSELTVKYLFSPLFINHAEVACNAGWHYLSTSYQSFNSPLPVEAGISLYQPPKA